MVLAHSFSQVDRTHDVKISQDVTFDSMLLTPKTLKGLHGAGFFKPSPIQLYGIPIGKCGFDLLLEAKSGTGKTAVFAVITLEKIDLRKGLQAVVLAPTREIASQICDVMKQIGSEFKGLQVEVVMGGLPVQDDIEKFKNKPVHVVVGSPGRLKHLIHDNHIDISLVRLLILDEADKLMEKSFQTDIHYIFTALPKQKQVIMSSATYSESSKTFINPYVKGVQHICPENNSILLGIIQKVTIVKYNSNIVRQTQYRFQELLKILNTKPFKQCLIFCNYQARIAELHKLLTREKWPAEQLYGQQEQNDRLGALKTLQEYKCRILICTDLAARGIDASNVDLVINFEPPFEWQTYLHRIGRAGRFGSYGIAISILSEGSEENKFKKELDLMKDSLDIRYLWTDEPFKFDESDKEWETLKPIEIVQPESVEPTLSRKETFDEIWQILTGDNENDLDSHKNILESFEQLCKSLEDSKKDVNIESFADLLNSYENDDFFSNKDNYSYPVLEAKPIPKCFNLSSNLKKYALRIKSFDRKKAESLQPLDNKSETCNDKDINANRMTNNNKSDNFNEISQHQKEKQLLALELTPTKYSLLKQNGNDVDEKIVDIEDELIEMNRDLINSGLPLAFTSTKFKHRKDKNFSKYQKQSGFHNDDKSKHQLFKNQTLLTIQKPVHCFSASYNTLFDRSLKSQQSNIEQDKIKVHSDNRKTNSIPNTRFTDQDIHSEKNISQYLETYFRTSDHSKKPDCLRGENKFNLPQSKKQSRHVYSTAQESSEVDSSSCDSSTEDAKSIIVDHRFRGSNPNKHYHNWYNQLKQRVYQIQFALYLEEMSKI